MTTLRMDDTNIDESPPTIAYVLIAMLSAIYDFELSVDDDGIRDANIRIVDDESETAVAELIVSPVMGELFIAVMTQIGFELVTVPVGKPWASQT